MYYLQSRYYDPEISRFINADAVIATVLGLLGNNMFTYCINNPINFVDYNGETTASIFEWWGSTMWVLCLVDLVYPIGDALYVVGLIFLGLLVAVSCSGSTPVTNYNAKRANKSTASKRSSSATAGGAASPKPPKKDNNHLSFSKEFKGDTVYNKDGIQVHYEYNGNGTGNIHIHTKEGKFYFDSQGFFKTGPGNAPSASTAIQLLLQNKAIMKAIMKALYIIKGLGGVLV